MLVDLSRFIDKNQTVAVALSGGSDSMALVHYMLSVKDKFRFNVIALNVEHGIRGKASISDTEFVKKYCEKLSVPLITYSVDSLKKAEEENLSVEQAARILRYECFYDAIRLKKCDLVATAHHSRDNLESILFNLFRGTGLSGAGGIKQNYENKIIRPFLSVSKEEIDEYVKTNDIPFVTDESNFDTDYTRNHLRLKVLPEIKTAFPEAEKALTRFAKILETDNEYLLDQAEKSVTLSKEKAQIPLSLHRAIFSRAVIIALKHLGVTRDWEKTHIDSVYNLTNLNNGSSIDLPKNIVAVREYDKISFYKKEQIKNIEIDFTTGTTEFLDDTLEVIKVNLPVDLKSGFFVDGDKIPLGAKIRTKKDGDKFTKFGGGTKSLNDYLTDKKIPLRVRDKIAVLASGNDVLAIFGIAVSDKVKVDDTTLKILKLGVTPINK